MNAAVRTVDPACPPSAFCGLRFRRADRTVVAFGREELDQRESQSDTFQWIDIESTDVASLNATLRSLGFDLTLGRHIDDPAVLPRIVEHASCLACYVYEVADPERHLAIANGLAEMGVNRLILLVSSDAVVTFHRAPIPCIDYVRTRSIAVFPYEGSGPSLVAYLLFQRCLYEYAHLNLANDNYLDELRAGLRAEDFEELADLVERAHANILTLKKMVASLQIVLGRLTTMQTPFVDEEFRGRVLQLHKNAFPVRWSLDSSRQFLDGIVNGMQTAASNRVSEIATVLTIVSTVILPLTLITGVYGMNFDIPEIHMRFGYFICLTVMAAIVSFQVYLYHRLGWLRSILRSLRSLGTGERDTTRDLTLHAALADPSSPLDDADPMNGERAGA